MAAAPATFEGVLTNIGFNAATRAVLIDPNKENLSLASLITWKDEAVDELVRSLRKTNIATAADTVTYPYIPVSAIEKMKAVVYVCRHMERCQRTPQRSFFTARNIKLWSEERVNEKEY